MAASKLLTFGFGIVRSDDSSRRTNLGELCAIMSNALGATFVPHLAVGYRQLGQAVSSGDVALAWMPPLIVLELTKHDGGSALALPVRYGSTASFFGGIIVRRGGPKNISELKGMRAAWVERESVAGYIMPRIHLGLNGFELSSFASETLVHTHEGVVDAVVSGRADVGATFCTVDPRTNRIVHGAWTNPDGTSGKPIEVLATAGPIPNDAIAVSHRVAPEWRAKFLDWLLAGESLRARELFVQLLRATSFVRAMPSHYAPLRAALAEAQRKGLYVGPT